jgi:tetratricopeptide (TPR) repeat protein
MTGTGPASGVDLIFFAALHGQLTAAQLSGLGDGELMALLAMGQTRLQTGRAKQAAALFSALTAFAPYTARFWRALGLARHHQGHWAHAGFAYAAALALEPEHALTACWAAEAYLLLGDTARAEPLAVRAWSSGDVAARTRIQLLTGPQAPAGAANAGWPPWLAAAAASAGPHTATALVPVVDPRAPTAAGPGAHEMAATAADEPTATLVQPHRPAARPSFSGASYPHPARVSGPAGVLVRRRAPQAAEEVTAVVAWRQGLPLAGGWLPPDNTAAPPAPALQRLLRPLPAVPKADQATLHAEDRLRLAVALDVLGSATRRLPDGPERAEQTVRAWMSLQDWSVDPQAHQALLQAAQAPERRPDAKLRGVLALAADPEAAAPPLTPRQALLAQAERIGAAAAQVVEETTLWLLSREVVDYRRG